MDEILMTEKTEKIVYFGESRGRRTFRPDVTEPRAPATIIDDDTLTDGQREAIDMYRRGDCFFLSGSGGTGKSYLIHHIIREANRGGRKIAVTAMTGCAAVLLNCGAKTLHSWAGIGLGGEPVDAYVQKIRSSGILKKRWVQCETLIIDEVSMLTGELLDKLDEIARRVRGINHPFGSIQLILVGDFFQLPPISKVSIRKYYAFESNFWQEAVKQRVILTVIHRQTDPIFVDILNSVRFGSINPDQIAVLETRRVKSVEDITGEIKPTQLYTMNIDVDNINTYELDRLEGPVIRSVASTSIGPIVSHLPEHSINTAIAVMDKSMPYTVVLQMKVGAQVMLVTNLDFTRGLVNGSRGIIVAFTPKTSIPIVKFRNGIEMMIDRQEWASEEYPDLIRRQYPLRLAWASTIHKMQGQSLDCVAIDCGSSVFEYGQTYVALSRVRSLEGLWLIDFDPTKIKAHPKITEFYEKLVETPAEKE